MMSPVMFSPAKIALFTLLTACSVGAVDGDATPDAPPSQAELSFNMTITPIVARCTAPSCHGGGISPNMTSYGMLTSSTRYTMKPGNQNILVTKGNHANITYFTPMDSATMEMWINTLP
jgi:hypothetical protein